MGKLDCMNEDIVQAGLQGLLLPWSALLWGGLGVDGSRFKTPEFDMKHAMEMLKMHDIVNHNQLGQRGCSESVEVSASYASQWDVAG